LKLLHIVNPGIEDIAALEIVSELGGFVDYEVFSGRVYHIIDSVDYDALHRLRSVNRVFQQFWDGFVGSRYSDLVNTYDELYKTLIDIEIWRYLSPTTSFRVVGERVGEHDYTSIDVSRLIGDLVIRVVEDKAGYRPRVNLKTPMVIIYVFIKQNRMSLGLSLTGSRSLHRRSYRVYDHPAAIKPTLAYAMLVLAGSRDKQVIVDPMCGGGTIVIEARYLYEDAEIYCMDINRKYLNQAMMNALSAGVYSRIVFKQHDARKLHEFGEGFFDHIVSNPPYGIRYGDQIQVRSLYKDFIGSSYRALRDGGRLTIITTEYNYVNKLLRERGFIKIHERVVQHGGLYPHIIVAEKQ